MSNKLNNAVFEKKKLYYIFRLHFVCKNKKKKLLNLVEKTYSP